jgi:hypothetical protein
MSAPSFVGALSGCLLLGLSVFLHAGCGTSSLPRSNQRPEATLTSGPVEGDTVSYSITIAWEGSDPDGVIDRFEYAVDPPSAFTEEEISEGGPDIAVEELPGDGDNPAVTRVSKTTFGETVFFDWVHTIAFSRRFMFSTPEAGGDSTQSGFAPSGRFFGMHAIYVRSVDDRGGTSVPDKVAFTASNVAPESRITRPRLEEGQLQTGLTVAFEWTGEDPDSPHPGQAPDHYLFRGVRRETICPPIAIEPPICPSPRNLGPFDEWEVLEPGVTSRTLVLEPGIYLYGIVAVDENGGVEPFLDVGRNVVRLLANLGGGLPTVTLSTILGTYTGAGNRTFEAELPTNTDLEARVACNADLYGEECAEFRWGLDIADLESPEDWSPWTPDLVIPPIVFARPGVHVLYVQARDTLGNVSTLALILTVIEFTFDRDVLLVDDSHDDLFPSDAEHDAFWRQLFQNYGVDPIFEFSCFGDDDRGSLSPRIPALEEMGRYKLLVWVNFGSGYNGESALLKAASLTKYLEIYLKSGGQLWVVGRMTVPPMLPSPNGLLADLTYPIDDERLHMGTFAWDLMKLRTTQISNPKGGSDEKDLLWGVAPFPGEPAPYDSMTIDRNKVRYPYQVAVPYCDAIFDPIFAESDPAFPGDIDSLYTYRAYGREGLRLPQPPERPPLARPRPRGPPRPRPVVRVRSLLHEGRGGPGDLQSLPELVPGGGAVRRTGFPSETVINRTPGFLVLEGGNHGG